MKTAAETRANFEVLDPKRMRCMVNGCGEVLKLSDPKATSSLRRHLAGSAHNLFEYLSAGDALLARSNEQEREQWKRQRDDVWKKAGVTISAPTATKVFSKLDKKQRKLVATMFASFDIVAHMRPFSSLQDMGRRAMAGVIGCHYPSKSACRSMVLTWFGEYVAELRKELADIEYISLTSDGWTNYATEHAGQVYNKRRLRLHEPVAESIIVMHESRRFCARRIVETSPLAIQEIVRNNLQRAGALSDEDVDYASEISQESVGESEGSFASSDNE